MRVAVTGATGFIGGAVARALASRGHDVVALGRAPRGPAGLEYVSWDLTADAPAPGPLAACDAVIHAAAHVAAWGDATVFEAATVQGTRRLLDAIDPMARLVVIGSGSVYPTDGRTTAYRETDGPVDDDRYLGPYPRAKASQERLVSTRRPDAVVLRPRIVWGPGDRTLLPRVERRMRGGRIVLPDGGRHAMSTTHVSTLVAAVHAALERPAVAGPVNVADATPRSPAELLSALFAARGRPLRIVGIPWRLADALAVVVETATRVARSDVEPAITRYAVRAFGAPVVLDLGRLHRELGIAPDVDLQGAAQELAGD